MSEFTQSDPYQVIWLVRRLFRSLAQRSGELLEEFDISAADRAVLEFLFPAAKLSVPQIARRYQVSRQHVQVTANALIEKGLIEALENPRHKRSPLMKLSARGRALFSRVFANDQQVVESLFAGLPAADLAVTRRTLQCLLDELEGGTR
jgi:DNA-binding MarR family transcriptional regulator